MEHVQQSSQHELEQSMGMSQTQGFFYTWKTGAWADPEHFVRGGRRGRGTENILIVNVF